MNVRPVFFRSPDDDGAPLDYSYVPSVSEGRRRQQEQAIHQKDSPSAPIVRHRAAPYERDAVDIYGTRARRTPAEPEAIRERMRELIEKRRASQPLDMPSAGSTFKRPAVGYAAALIDQAGLKGFAVGGAQVSEKHAGFVINRGGATFDDVVQLMEHIQKTVFEKSGVRLEPEVRILKG